MTTTSSNDDDHTVTTGLVGFWVARSWWVGFVARAWRVARHLHELAAYASVGRLCACWPLMRALAAYASAWPHARSGARCPVHALNVETASALNYIAYTSLLYLHIIIAWYITYST